MTALCQNEWALGYERRGVVAHVLGKAPGNALRRGVQFLMQPDHVGAFNGFYRSIAQCRNDVVVQCTAVQDHEDLAPGRKHTHPCSSGLHSRLLPNYVIVLASAERLIFKYCAEWRYFCR